MQILAHICDLSEEIVPDPKKPCRFSGGIDIGNCTDCPHLVISYTGFSAKMIPENEPIPVEDIPVQEEEKEECEQKLLIENPDFLEID